MKKLLLVAAILAMGAVASQAATTFITASGDISVTNNWDNGMPILGNQGTIGIAATRTADVDISGWDIVVGSGGSIADASTGYGQNEVLGGSIFDIQSGGTYTRSGSTWRWHGGSTFKVSGGTVHVLGLIGMGTTPGGFTVDVSGGTFDSDKLFNYNNGVNVSTFNVSGGTAVIGVVDGAARIIDEANTFFNISGTGSLTINNLDYATTANDTNIVVTISDAGQFVTHVFDNVAVIAQPDRYIDFATDNTSASWTWIGKSEADFIALWNDGTLRHNGSSSGAFADHFLVTFDKVSLLPPQESTDFTNGSGDGTWANSLNWDNGVPTAAKVATVNAGLTANLSGGTGNALIIKVGDVDSESGSVVNGSLIVVKGTQVGVATGASGSLDLTTYTAGTDADNTQVGAADNASGSLVAGSGAITGNSLDVGTGSGSVGTLDMGTGSLSFDNATMIGGATSASGTVDAASFTLSGNSDLTIGSSSNAYGRLTASNGSVASAVLSIASGQDSVGTLDMGSGTVTVGDTVNIATGQDSTATVTLGSAMVLASTNGLFVGTGAGSSQNLTASDFSVSGPIGDFGVGEGTGASLKGLFSLHETIGSVTVNSPLELTAGSHTILGLMLAGGTGTTGSLALSGSASVILTNTIDIASGDGSSASLDLADLVTGDHVAGTINVGRGDQSVGSLTYTAGNLLVTAAAGMEVGTSGNGSDATVLLKSLSGGSILSICQNSGVSAPTGTVTVLENASNGTVRVARALNSVGTLTVGGTLTAGQYLNSAGLESNAVGRITAATLNKTGTGSTQVAQGVNTDGSIIASNGTLLGNLYVATANGSLGLFAVTNGMASPTILQIATGDGSDGTVLVGITSPATNDVVIGTGSNAIGRLTLPAGTLTAADLTLGGAGTGAGTITVAGGDLVVTGAVSAVNSSFIDVTDDASTFTWTGRVEADFIALWDAGTLRRDGESGLTAATFSDYFQVSGDVLSASTSYPIGTIVITGPIAGGGMIISWDTTLGQSYDVQTNGNLIIPNWNVYDTVVGDGGGMSVTSATAQAELFYKVTSD